MGPWRAFCSVDHLVAQMVVSKVDQSDNWMVVSLVGQKVVWKVLLWVASSEIASVGTTVFAMVAEKVERKGKMMVDC
jgi:hypothetical protein